MDQLFTWCKGNSWQIGRPLYQHQNRIQLQNFKENWGVRHGTHDRGHYPVFLNGIIRLI